MSIMLYGQSEPMSSGEVQTTSPERVVDIEQKHRAVSDFLASHQFDALLLQKPSNFAWFTAGVDNFRGGASETTAALFITPESRVIITSNSHSAQLFDRELLGLGFSVKERPWHEPRHFLIDDLCRGRSVASDTGYGRTRDIAAQITSMRIPLSVLECERVRELGKHVAHAVEATARHFQRGQSEAEVAGELAHRLIKHEVIPERLQVWADGQGERYPTWNYSPAPIQHFVTIAAIGRRWGLCAAASRTVCFGELPNALRSAYHRAVLVQSTGMFFSQAEWELFEVWNRTKRIYEKYGIPDEWQSADQGEVTAYQVCEIPVVPKSEFRLTPRMAVHWHPQVGPAKVSDTILVGDEGFELLTPLENWPKLKVEIKGKSIFRPGILRRELDEPSTGGSTVNLGPGHIPSVHD